MEDPDDPARQDECARRLLAYAAELRAKQPRQSSESDTYDESPQRWWGRAWLAAEL